MFGRRLHKGINGTERKRTIKEDLKNSYGIVFDETISVSGAWLNRKWKAHSGGESFLVKEFSRRRYTDSKMVKLEAALQ